MAAGNDFFTGVIEENGDICVVAGSREYRKVGIDSRREEEMLQAIRDRDETLDNWRSILIENGLLKLPKTAEEIAQEAALEQLRLAKEQADQQAEVNQALLRSIENQSEMMASQLEMINSLQYQIKEMKTYEHDGNSGAIVDIPRPKQHQAPVQNIGKVAGPNKVSAGTRTKNVAQHIPASDDSKGKRTAS